MTATEELLSNAHRYAEAFANLESDLRQSIARLRASPFLSHLDAVRGFVYEVETGRLREARAGGQD